MFRTIMMLYALVLTGSIAAAAEDARPYRLGQGIQIGTLPLYAGGYFSFEYERVDDTGIQSLALDDISLMLYGENGRYSYMAEFESNDVYTEILNGPDKSENVNLHLHIERFYLDYTVNDNYTVRVGKYNSPIGIWNPIPINVLRDTTSNPMIVQFLYPHFTSGLDLQYRSHDRYEHTVDVMLQESRDLDAVISDTVYNNYDTDRHYGVDFAMTWHGLQMHLDGGLFRVKDQENRYYATMAFRYAKGALRLQGEVGTQRNSDGATIPYMGYLQGHYEIKEGHEAILRLESYDDNTKDEEDTFGVIGYTYRPLYPVALKAEYQKHVRHSEDKLLFSVSVLF